MTADELFDAFVAADRAGERPQPRAFLDRAEAGEQPLLASLIEHYLDHAPPAPPPMSFAAFKADATARRAMAAAEPALRGETWPALLPAARDAAQVSRLTLVQRLAEALGVGDREQRVGDYYHRMETGTLEPAGVSDRVLQALADIVAVPMQRLREAGARTTLPPAGGAVFARTASLEGVQAEVAPAAPAADAAEPDEVDRLFTGG